MKRERFDILHVFGYPRSGHLGGLLTMLDRRTPVVFTLLGGGFPSRLSRFSRHLYGRLACIITSTRFTIGLCEKVGLPARLIRHGIVRNLREEAGDTADPQRQRVLFWRDPSPANGADLVITAFDEIAPLFLDIDFDFAIRPIWDEVEGIDELAKQHANVHVYRFPYENGITLPKLVLGSLLVVMPFRELSINPQFAIAESVAAGVPVITSDLESNPEIVKDGHRGTIVPTGDSQSLANAIRRLLTDRERLVTMGRESAISFAAEWNWETYAEKLTQVYEEVK